MGNIVLGGLGTSYYLTGGYRPAVITPQATKLSMLSLRDARSCMFTSDAVLPSVSALSAVEEQGHALLGETERPGASLDEADTQVVL